MSGITIYEFDAVTAARPGLAGDEGLHAVPAAVFDWLEARCLRAAEVGDAAWLRLTQRRGRRAVQVTSYVGVIRAPDGYQIEVLPKLGKAIDGGAKKARQMARQTLIEMRSSGVRQLRPQVLVFARTHFQKCHYNSANCSGAAGFSIPNA